GDEPRRPPCAWQAVALEALGQRRAVGDGGSEQLARRCGRRHAMAAEAEAIPEAALRSILQAADLRHLVPRIAHHPAPRVLVTRMPPACEATTVAREPSKMRPPSASMAAASPSAYFSGWKWKASGSSSAAV